VQCASSIIYIQLKKVIKFHDSLHGFGTQRGTVAATVEAKLRMQLYQWQQQTLYQVFIDLKKAYDTLHRGRTLEIMKDMGWDQSCWQSSVTFGVDILWS
jgi:hypothetical protein